MLFDWCKSILLVCWMIVICLVLKRLYEELLYFLPFFPRWSLKVKSSLGTSFFHVIPIFRKENELIFLKKNRNRLRKYGSQTSPKSKTHSTDTAVRKNLTIRTTRHYDSHLTVVKSQAYEVGPPVHQTESDWSRTPRSDI